MRKYKKISMALLLASIVCLSGCQAQKGRDTNKRCLRLDCYTSTDNSNDRGNNSNGIQLVGIRPCTIQFVRIYSLHKQRQQLKLQNLRRNPTRYLRVSALHHLLLPLQKHLLKLLLLLFPHRILCHGQMVLL